MQIVAHGEDAFFYPGGFTHLKFERNNSGHVFAMDMHHGGADDAERALRLSGFAEGGRTVHKVSPEIYDLLVGQYAMSSGTMLHVRRNAAQLIVQTTDQPEFEVFPSSTTRYFLKDVEAEIEFSIGDDGRAEAATIFQGGTEDIGTRVD